MTGHTITFNLSVSSVKAAIKDLEDYKKDLANKCNMLSQKLAEKGVEIAKLKIGEYDAIYTGELLTSINCEQGAVVQDGAKWIVYTNCPWAKFVEFGTGIVGSKSPHHDTSIIGWKYDVNEHGEEGWFYFRDQKWHWTKGLPSRPFIYETAQDLREIVVYTAKEIFG